MKFELQVSIFNQIELDMIQNRKKKLSPRSYSIQFERTWKSIFLNVLKFNQTSNQAKETPVYPFKTITNCNKRQYYQYSA